MPPAPGLVDIHCHLLPGVDDGVETLAQTVELLQVAHRQGTRRMVTTPHMFHPQFANNNAAAIRQSFAAFKNELSEIARRRELGFLREMRVDLGAENHVSAEFLEALERGETLSMNMSDHMLIEFSGFATFDQALSAVERVREAGYRPILAHIERYPVLHERPGRLEGLVEAGAILQINAQSLLHWGGGPRRRCFDLLRNGLAQIVASDAHNTADRGPNLGPVREVLAKKFGHERARAWLSERPAQALDSPRPPTA